MSAISVTNYTNGKGAPFYMPGERHLSIEEALSDMFDRLRAGAALTTSGFNYGLGTDFGPEEAPTGSDQAIYGGLSPKLQDFLIRATKWWEEDSEAKPGTPAHEWFIRRHLLKVTGYNLTDAEADTARNMAADQFIAAMSMAIETGEDIAELFRSSCN